MLEVCVYELQNLSEIKGTNETFEAGTSLVKEACQGTYNNQDPSGVLLGILSELLPETLPRHHEGIRPGHQGHLHPPQRPEF